MARLEKDRGSQADPDLQIERKAPKPGIGGLGEPDYQRESLRVKSFCGLVIDDPETYHTYLKTKLFPAVEAHADVTRIIDRVIVRDGVFLPSEGLKYPLRTEATVRLGGRWAGYNWVMNGASLPGRELSNDTKASLLMLAQEAKEHRYTPPQELPPGFRMEKLTAEQLSEQDIDDLAEIFRLSFRQYLSPLSTPDDVRNWINGGSMYPVAVRNEAGRIVVVASGDIAKMSFGDREFRFFEIGDSAGHPDYRNAGLNRRIKHYLLSEATKMDFDSIHTETRAAWLSPNMGNARNGMTYSGTLWLNCQIGGIEDVAETEDPNLAPESRRMGSLNIWAMTPANPLWHDHYEQFVEPELYLVK